jgi:preprotein translocase subunit SecG
MSLLIGFLTFILVVTCLFLILLVLVQLPKKEAGAGLAFGAGTVDTLIGAGSGNALTKMTKYAAGIFLGLAVVLAMLNAQRHEGQSRGLQEELSRKASAVPMLPTAPASAPTSGTLSNNQGITVPPVTVPSTGTPSLNLQPAAQNPAPAQPQPSQP